MKTKFKLRLCLSTFAISPFVLALYLPARPVHKPQQSGAAIPPAQSAQPSAQITRPGPSTPLASSNNPKLSPHEQIQADTKKLYQLSFELRTEVGKTYKQSLSLDVLRKAEELEKLAKSLKSEMDHEASEKKR